jgi:hypothetical protein
MKKLLIATTVAFVLGSALVLAQTLGTGQAQTMPSATLTATTNQLTLGASAHTTIFSATAPAAASQTVTFPDPTGADSVAYLALAQTFTNKTLTSPTINGATLGTTINTDYKVLAAPITYTSNVTPAVITGFSWTVVPGTYIFEVNLPTTMTTVGGFTQSFVLTTAVITSIQYQTYAATASDNTTAVSTQGTTTTSATKVFDSKTAAYTYVQVRGSMVVGTGGTITWDGCQNTSAGGGDVTTLLLGGYAKLVRVL